MAILTVTFSQLNTSIQVGDTGYYTTVNSVGGFNQSTGTTIEIGVIKDIIIQDSSTIVIFEQNSGVQTPTYNDFFFFSKDNSVNMSSILGYYGEVEFKNNSTSKAEMFATACGLSESSK